ncbi:MAG: hypothetical protein AABZ53_10185, partial [Planctomycetota bacterium]
QAQSPAPPEDHPPHPAQPDSNPIPRADLLRPLVEALPAPLELPCVEPPPPTSRAAQLVRSAGTCPAQPSPRRGTHESRQQEYLSTILAVLHRWPHLALSG